MCPGDQKCFLYSVTPQLKANLTINTDFAQTEVDDRQVNLTRFPLFFPEKRDFFLEGAGNFDFSGEGRNDLTAFFTRRIGLDENGRPQKIDYGAKMTGQVGRFNLGLMQVRTAVEGRVAGEDFFVFRPKRRLLSQSSVGFIYTRRSTRDSALRDRHSVGVDFQLATPRFRGNQNAVLTGHYLKTPDGTHAGENTSWALRFNMPNDRWRFQLFTRMSRGTSIPPSASPSASITGSTPASSGTARARRTAAGSGRSRWGCFRSSLPTRTGRGSSAVTSSRSPNSILSPAIRPA